MKRSLKFILLILLPVLGYGLGYACAYADYSGLLETWQPARSPGEAIVRIAGMREGSKLIVVTGSGRIYSTRFLSGDEAAQASRLTWQVEQLDKVEPVAPLRYYGADFSIRPPPFHVQQLFDVEYIYAVEGKGEIRFALAPDGSLWMWSHRIAGLTGMVFFFYPAFGVIVGLAAILTVVLAGWIKRKRQAAIQ